MRITITKDGQQKNDRPVRRWKIEDFITAEFGTRDEYDEQGNGGNVTGNGGREDDYDENRAMCATMTRNDR